MEHKFRLIDKDGEIVGFEFDLCSKWKYARKLSGTWHDTRINHTSKEQYAGIKDSKGDELYAGDVCSYENEFCKLFIGIVVFEEGSFVLKVKGKEYEEHLLSGMLLGLTKLGTIHDAEYKPLKGE